MFVTEQKYFLVQKLHRSLGEFSKSNLKVENCEASISGSHIISGLSVSFAILATVISQGGLPYGTDRDARRKF